MATWNRNVDDGGEYLIITKTAQNPDPPPPPERNDTAIDITTYGADRPATINYHAPGNDVTLTGISMKNGDPIPAELSVFVNPAGNLLRLTDSGAAGTDYEYYVEGDGKRTEDPRIRNHA